MSSLVYVVDTSSLINIKHYIKAERQWDFFNETMTQMVERGAGQAFAGPNLLSC